MELHLQRPILPDPPDIALALIIDAVAGREEVRKSALEFMLSLSKAKPGMMKKVDSWAGAVVRVCMEGMGVITDDELDVWLKADVSSPAPVPYVFLSSLPTRVTMAFSSILILLPLSIPLVSPSSPPFELRPQNHVTNACLYPAEDPTVDPYQHAYQSSLD